MADNGCHPKQHEQVLNLTHMQTVQDCAFLPNDLKAGRFTQFAFDNLDFKEYIKDGRTPHFTSNLSLKDRQRSRSLVGVEMEPKLPVCFAETLDHLSTVWHLVDVCPTVGGSKTKLYCSNMKFIPGIFVYLIPPHQLW